MSQAAGIRAGRAYVELSVNDSRLVKGLQVAQARLRAFGAGLTRIGGGLIGAGAGLAAPLLAAASHFSASGDELSKASDRTGASVESLSELRHAASQSAVDFGTLTKAMNKQQRGLAEAADGNETARAAYENLGLSVEKLLELSPDQQFEAVAEQISQIEDPAKRTAAAMDIFGKSGADLMPLMIGGAAGIETLRKEARDLGLQVSGEDAKNAAILGDTWANVKDTMMGMVFQVGAALAPMLIEITSRIVSLLAMASQWVRENRQLVVWIAAVAAGLIAAGTVLVGFGGFLMAGAAAIGAVISVAGTMVSLFTAILSPVGLLIAGVVGLGAAFFYFTAIGQDTITWFWTEFQKLTQIVTDTVGGIYTALTAGNLGLAAEIAFTGVKLAIATVMESVLGLFGSSIDDMMGMLAAVIKRVGEVAAKVTSVAADAGSWITNQLADSGLLDPATAAGLRVSGAAMQVGAQQWEDDWKGWDSEQAGKDWAKALDTDAIKKKLDELNATANKELEAVEQKELELRAATQKEFEGPNMSDLKIQSGMQEKGAVFSTFSGSIVGQNFGLGNLQEKQLQVQQDLLASSKNIEKNTKSAGSSRATA
jgi:hypothetical protein